MRVFNCMGEGQFAPTIHRPFRCNCRFKSRPQQWEGTWLWVANTQYNIQVMCYRLVPLKPIESY